jgi:hypothetical protein
VGGRGLKGADNEALPLCHQVHLWVDGHAKLPNGEVGRRATMAWLGWDDSGIFDGERSLSTEQAEATWKVRASFWWAKFCRETGRDMETGRKR